MYLCVSVVCFVSGTDMILPPAMLTTASIRAAAWGYIVPHTLAAALQAVEPSVAMRRAMHCRGTALHIGTTEYNLEAYEHVYIVGAGKAGAAMARAAVDIIGDFFTEGIVIVKGQPDAPDLPIQNTPAERLSLLTAGHPVPDERGVEATQRIAHLLERTTANDLVLVLISGGGSALLTLPAPGIALRDIQHLTTLLLACGAPINDINAIRKHLDLVKGGGIARMAAPSTVATLILSDVVGNPLDVIASGPTTPDPTTYDHAWEILEHYRLTDQVSPAIVAHLHAGMRGERTETAKPDDPMFERVSYTLIGSNEQAATAALLEARRHGLHTMLLTVQAQGEAQVVGHMLGAIGRELAITGWSGGIAPAVLPRPACLVMGGETTVTLRGNGTGGRNQEMALATVRTLAGVPNLVLVTLATDGNDGPTDAAGAVVTGETLARALQRNLSPEHALATNDSYHFFAALDDLLKPGLTGTNVNDLAFIFCF